MDAWEFNRLATLVKSVEDHAPGGAAWLPRREGTGTAAGTVQDSQARRYDALIREGRLRSAVRMLTERDGGSLYMPDDLCTKTKKPVIEVLEEKHPEGVIPRREDFEEYVEDEEEDGPCLPVFCWEEDVAVMASRLQGTSGPCGVTAKALSNWLLRHKEHSMRLRVDLAEWAKLLANYVPSYAMYRALNAGRMLAADKDPGIGPLLCREAWMRVILKCVLYGECKELARKTCGNVQLCTGLEAGIEGNLHAVRAVWPEPAGWQYNSGTAEDPINVICQEMCTDADRKANSRYQPDTGYGVVLVDADNGFNRIHQYLMLWTVFNIWERGNRFAFNRYRHHNIVVVQDEAGRPPIIIHSREGVAQGFGFGMFLYGIGMMPLCEGVCEHVADADSLQTWFADNLGAMGTAEYNAKVMAYMAEKGPRRGYFTQCNKSWYVCKGEGEAVARCAFEERGLEIRFTRGHRYLGGWLGDVDGKKAWLEDQVVGASGRAHELNSSPVPAVSVCWLCILS
ncbi:hypothetical protein ACHAWF_006753 [Thalassiosira exigua]